MPPLVAGRAQAHPRKGGRGWMVVAILAIFLLIVTQLIDLTHLSLPAGFDVAGAKDGYLEESVTEPGESENKVAVIEVKGVITAGDNGDGVGMVALFKRKLKRAAQDDAVRAVVVDVDSPGGEVLASDDIAKAIEKFQAEHHKPVIASMGSLAASGGYYVSAPCRWIVAHPLTITGSIGVIMHGFNYRGLMDKLGLRAEVYKSGKFKDMLSGTRSPEEVPEGEAALVQALIDETYERFKEVVKDGREFARKENKMHGFEEKSRPLAQGWETMADGRVFSGRTAWTNGFVDELGNLDTAIKRAKELSGISDAKVVRYNAPFRFGNFFSLLGQVKDPGVRIDLGIRTPEIDPGRLYFLSSTYIH
jgi:protease-4